MLRFRPFEPTDRNACLEIFDSNSPLYLHPGERGVFEAWLEAPEGTYLVLTQESEVIGCGGYALETETQLLSLTWGLLHADQHGRHLGELMLLERLLRGVADTAASVSRLATTPQVESFFARVGYRRTDLIANGWGPSLDKVEMRLDFDPAILADLRRRHRELMIALTGRQEK